MTAAPFMAPLIAGLFFGFRVYIRFFGNGRQWFRSYSGSLGKTECRPTPSNQGLLPLTFGASPWLGLTSGRVPQQRPRRPTGRPVSDAYALPCRSCRVQRGCDLLTLFFYRQDQKIAAFGSSYGVIHPRIQVGCRAAIAGKPAPTVDRRTSTLLTTHQAER
jgi:hypothetical protein